jgi:AbiV family abortive infection protein
LVILALEELAKIPDLHDTCLSSVIRAAPKLWTDFWRRFYRHSDKQALVAAYGRELIPDLSDGVSLFGNQSPFIWKIPESVLKHLDVLKQEGFYVGFEEDCFRSLADQEESVSQILDYLFAAAEERLDNFCSSHITESRSLALLQQRMDLLRAAAKVMKPDAADLPSSADVETLKSLEIQAQDFPKPTEVLELRADIRSAAAAYTSSAVPDHWHFRSFCKELVLHQPDVRIIKAFRWELKYLQERVMEQRLPSSASRAKKMSNLLIGYVDREMKETASKRVFRIFREKPV